MNMQIGTDSEQFQALDLMVGTIGIVRIMELLTILTNAHAEHSQDGSITPARQRTNSTHKAIAAILSKAVDDISTVCDNEYLIGDIEELLTTLPLD